MSKASDSWARRKKLHGLSEKAKTPPPSRAGLPGFGGDPVPTQVKKPQTATKLNTPTKRSAQPSVTPPTAGLAASKGANHVQPSADKHKASAAAVSDPYDFPIDDAEDAVAQPKVLASSAGAEKKKMRAGGNRLGSLWPGKQTHLGRSEIPASNTSRQLFHGPLAGKTSDGLSARQAAGQVTAAAGFSTAGAISGACVGGSAAGGNGSMLGRSKQMGIRSFTVSQHLLGSPTTYSGQLPAGMVNHGNTCYLNAVLQALLSLPCLAQDLTSHRLQQLQLPADCVTHALRACLEQYATSCSGAGSERSGCAISPAVVSAAMARLSARWGSCRQEDAHEFLTALLDALQTEVLALQLKSLKGPTCSSSPTPTTAGAASVASVTGTKDKAVAAADTVLHQPPCSTSEQGDQLLLGLAAAAAGGDGTAEAAVGSLVIYSDADCHAEATDATGAAASADMAPATSLPPSLRVSAVCCPASRNFSGCLQHKLVCSVCAHVTTVKEQFNHLSLDLPPSPGSGNAGKSSAPSSPAAGQQQQQHGSELDWMLSGGLSSKAAAALSGTTGAAAIASSEQYVPDLQSLLANFFAPEVLEKACEACGAAAAQHRLEHAVRRLPRVLVVHLKRFQWQVLAGGGAICRKLSTHVRPDEQLQLGPVCCPGRPVPPLLAELMPPGLLQAAHAACADPHSSMACDEAAAEQQGLAEGSKAAGTEGSAGNSGGNTSGLAGSKRSRSEGDAAAASPFAADGGLHGAASRGDSKQQEQLQQQPLQKHHRQQDLKSAWGSLGAAAAAGGEGTSFTRQHRPAQHGASRLSRMHQANDQQEQEQQQQQQPPTKKFLTNPVEGSTFSSVAAHGGRHTDFTQMQHDDDVVVDTGPGLQRNNSSTQVVNLVAAEDEDADLQQALALSLQTAAEEQVGREDPVMLLDRHGVDALAVVPAQDTCHATDMPDWMASRSAAANSGSPRTPKAAANIAGRQPLQPLQVGTTFKSDDLFQWAAQDAGPVAAAAGAAGFSGGHGSAPPDLLSGGGVGLSGGLALSDGGDASGGPAAQHQADDPDRYLGATPPNSPPRPAQPAGLGLLGDSNNSGGFTWADKGSKLLEGIENMSEEEQLKRALEQSMLDQGGSAAAGGGVVDLVGDDIAGKDAYDYDAALAAALAESAAEQERVLLAQQQQLQQGVAAEEQGQQHGAGASKAAVAGEAGEQRQGLSIRGDGAAAAAAVVDDDAVVVGGADGPDGSATDKQAQRPCWPVVRLVEDSDCEDDDQTKQVVAQPQQCNAVVAAVAAGSGHAAAPSAMQTDLQEAASSGTAIAAAAAASAVPQQQQQQQHVGKENQEDQCLAVSLAAASKPKQSKRRRRPLGELLVDREAANANRSNIPSSAAATNPLGPPVKEAAVAVAVAAAEAAAAASAGDSSCKGDELAATDAAAAAEVAGMWPQANAALYKLRAVVRHKGPLASSGHFVSDVMSNQQAGQWFHYDDSFVQPTRLETVIRRCETDGYLFFYVNSAILGQKPRCMKQL